MEFVQNLDETELFLGSLRGPVNRCKTHIAGLLVVVNDLLSAIASCQSRRDLKIRDEISESHLLVVVSRLGDSHAERRRAESSGSEAGSGRADGGKHFSIRLGEVEGAESRERLRATFVIASISRQRAQSPFSHA